MLTRKLENAKKFSDWPTGLEGHQTAAQEEGIRQAHSPQRRLTQKAAMMVDGFAPVPAVTTDRAPALHTEERTPQQRRASLEAKKKAKAAAALPKAASARAVTSKASSLPTSPRQQAASSRRQVKSSFLAGEAELHLAESWSPFSSAWEVPVAMDQVSLSLSDAPGTLGASRMLLVNSGSALHLDLLSSAHDLVALAGKSSLSRYPSLHAARP